MHGFIKYITPIEPPPVSFLRDSPSLPNRFTNHYSTPSGQDLTPASSVKDLGVHLSPNMKWSLQATIAARNANKMANWVLSVFSARSKDVLLSPYPLQEYCP